MAGKKAKSSASKPAVKAAGKASAKQAGRSAKPAAKAHGKASAGPLGSIKKMLGLGNAASKNGKQPTKETKALKPTKGAAPRAQAGKTGEASKLNAGGRAGKAAAAQQASSKQQSAKQHSTKQHSAAAAAKGGSKKAGQSGLPITDLRPSVLRPQGEPIAAGAPVCREVACELMSTTGGYCRMHYIKNWKKIKRKEMILKEKKLNSYIEELVSKYPDKYIEAIRNDLASEKDFAKVISDLEIDEGLDDFESVETESAEGIIDNLKRDFEDEGDVF